MSYLRLADAQIYFDEHGAGVPLVLVHGFNASGHTWRDAVAPLAARYRVIVPDLRGHGRSTGSPETIHHRQFAADLVALLDHLDVDRAHFVGHSSGGMCLLFVGTQHQERVRTLALVSATYTYDAVAQRQMHRLADTLSENPAAVAAARRLHGPVHGDDYLKVLMEVFRGFADDPSELPFEPADLHGISRPVLLLHGDRDEFFPVRVPIALYQAMPNSELCILPSTGHYPPRELPDLVLSVLTQFLERHADA
ncbi:MAG TPA: alpha/beta fold hydrolase [Chloroflexota bacterium]|nr:alpha/beta fold hydrolase [Chloroflexota bacterium]